MTTNVLITIGKLDRGGAEMRLLDLCREMSAKGVAYRVHLYVASGQSGMLDDQFIAEGVNLVSGFPGLRSIPHLWSVIRRNDIEIVHANGELGAAVYLVIARLAGVRRLYSHLRSTGYDSNGLWRRLRNRIYRPVLNALSLKVVGVCDGARELSKTPEGKWLTLYDGVPQTDLIAAAQSSKIELIQLGRLVVAKDPLRALTIARRLGQECDVALSYYGYGELQRKLEAQIDELGLASIVRVLGPTDDPSRTLSKASALILPSIREGMPGVVLEALAVGLPVVARDLPGVREIAGHVIGIIIVPQNADDDVWCEAILKATQLDRAEIKASFSASPFHVSQHARSTIELWASSEQAKKR